MGLVLLSIGTCDLREKDIGFYFLFWLHLDSTLFQDFLMQIWLWILLLAKLVYGSSF